MVAKPLVSVIINTYNRAALVVEAIESVLSQTYTNFELIVADDGSTDDTAERVAAYGREVRFLSLPHSGQPKNGYNAALRLARGELITFSDDDDLLHETKLARQVAVFTADPSLGMVFSDFHLLLPDGSFAPSGIRPEQCHSPALFETLLRGNFIALATVMIHRRMFDKFGGFSRRFDNQADYHYWLQIAHFAGGCCIPEPLVLVRRQPNSLSSANMVRDYRAAIDVLQEVRQSFPLTRPQRLILRRTLSRWYTHLGLLLRTAEPTSARSLFLRSLTCYPLQKRAWLALAGV